MIADNFDGPNASQSPNGPGREHPCVPEMAGSSTRCRATNDRAVGRPRESMRQYGRPRVERCGVLFSSDTRWQAIPWFGGGKGGEWTDWYVRAVPRRRDARPVRAGSVRSVRADLVERFRGRWVAVDDAGDVVADSDELGSLLERLEAAGVHAHTVQRVPGADDPLFVGLG